MLLLVLRLLLSSVWFRLYLTLFLLRYLVGFEYYLGIEYASTVQIWSKAALSPHPCLVLIVYPMILVIHLVR
jgi:hypothetical protein